MIIRVAVKGTVDIVIKDLTVYDIPVAAVEKRLNGLLGDAFKMNWYEIVEVVPDDDITEKDK